MDRPILFSGPMVRALLAGTKSQTRRVSKKQDWPEAVVRRYPRQHGAGYEVGDQLWVRETWRPVHSGDRSRGAQYRADHPDDWRDDTLWKSTRFMPRWASRLTLTVTDVRVQRLQEISETDAIAEGVDRQDPTPEDWDWYRGWADENGLDPNDPDGMRPVWLAPGTRQGFGPHRNDPMWGPTPQFAFRLLWNSLNAKRGFGWDTNSWVVALTFTVEQRNIDAEVR